MEIGNPQPWIEFKHARNELSRLIEPAGNGMTCGADPEGGEPIGSAQRLFCPCRSVVVPAGKEMRVSQSRMHAENERIKWIELDCPGQRLDTGFRISGINSQMPEKVPCGGKVWIESQRVIDISDRIVQLIGKKSERETSPALCKCILIRQSHSFASHFGSIGNLRRAVDHPAIHPLDDAAPRGHSVRRRKLWVELYRAPE